MTEIKIWLSSLALVFILLCSVPASDMAVADGATKSKSSTLTSADCQKPRINGAKVFGVRPGRPFLFTIPATGKRPIAFSTKPLPAKPLPQGLKLDHQTGRITGSVDTPGTYTVTLLAANSLGWTEREFRIVVGDKLALTPPMGWNSWMDQRQLVGDDDIRAMADAMVATGLINYGWTYINIDDGWVGKRNPHTGEIQPNERFPDMKALCDYVHSKGLKIGIYTDAGPKTCGRYEGSEGHEQQDVLTYAKWGFDYMKVDWCHCKGKDARAAYKKFGDALKDCSRDIVFSICNWGEQNPWEWGAEVGGQAWRTTPDVTDTWKSSSKIGFGQADLAKFARPGHWNDPDLLVIGMNNSGTKGRRLHPPRMNQDERRTYFSLWCLLSAPLMLSFDLYQLDDFLLSMLTNEEVLEVNQDTLGDQAKPVAIDGSKEVWAKTMKDGSKAVGLFNRGEKETTVKMKWSDLGVSGKQTVRNLWQRKDIGIFESNFEAKVPRHGVVLVKINPVPAER